VALGILPHRTLESVGAAGPATSFEEATSAMAAAQVGPHVVLADPLFGEAAKTVVGDAQLYLVRGPASSARTRSASRGPTAARC